MDEIASFGEWLRRRRKALDLTQATLADRAGCVPGTIKSIEADARRPSKQLAERLAEVLELGPDERALFLKAARAELSPDRLASPTELVTRAVGSTAIPPAAKANQRALPSGTVTFLFTDIEASTQLWEQHRQAMQRALTRHDTLLSELIAAHGGVVIKRTGDGMLAAFAQAPDALSAALAAQRALQTANWEAIAALPVRMALHTGVAEERERDYFGPALNRAARLLAVGHGGQILLSRATWEVVADHLPADVALRDLGVQQLKDLSRPEHIFQLAAPDLPADFPPLKTLDARRTNLPAQPTQLLGRERELAAIGELLRRDEVRLLSLTGPGGTGKTRLAVQAAAELLDAFADGVYFVDLAPIHDPELVIPTVAQALGVKEAGSQPLVKQLSTYLHPKQLLLLLDNFEQVVDAAPRVADLLAAAPQLKVLATSRVVLHLRGEKEYAVPPLNLPDLKQLPPLPALSQYAAVELFIQRAQDVKLDFQVTNESAPAVAEICHRLDGLPLAIELAAARIKLFAPEVLLKRLERRLGVLTSGPRDLPARQQTIRNTIDWSYRLLDAGEQTFFARLGVFVGGCTLEAAEMVCNPDGDLPFDVITGIAALVDKSLLRQADGLDSEPRFTMLETIREYALERLSASGEAEALWRQHAKYFLVLAEEQVPQIHSSAQLMAQNRLAVEYDNLRMVLVWAFDGGDAELGVQLAVKLESFWWARGDLSEARTWLEQALARSSGGASALRAALLEGLSGYVFVQGDYPRGIALAEEAVALYRALGNRQRIAQALNNLGTMLRNLGEYPQAITVLTESLELFRDVDDRSGMAAYALRRLGDIARDQGEMGRASKLLEASLALWQQVGDVRQAADTLSGLGDVALSQGDDPLARARFQEALALFRQVGDKNGSAYVLRNQGRVCYAQGDLAQAMTLLEESVAWFRQAGNEWGLAETLHHLGAVAAAQGGYARATVLLGQGLALQRKLGAKRLVAESLERFAGLAARQGQPAQAARLFGAAESLRGELHAPLPSGERAAYEHELAAVRAQLDETAFAAAWEAGRAMTLEQAVANALEA